MVSWICLYCYSHLLVIISTCYFKSNPYHSLVNKRSIFKGADKQVLVKAFKSPEGPDEKRFTLIKEIIFVRSRSRSRVAVAVAYKK